MKDNSMSTKNLPLLNGYEWRKPPKDIEFHFVINQVKYVEDLIAKSELAYDNDYAATIELLARYYRNYKQLPKNECEKLIYKYLNDYNIKVFGHGIIGNCSLYEKTISAACSTRRYSNCHGYKPLRDFDGISITKKEIETIQHLDSLQEQEVLFGVLCFTKMYNEMNKQQGRKINNLYYMESNVLRRCIGWKRNQKEQLFKVTSDLIERGFIGFIENRDKYSFLCDNRQPICTYQCNIVDYDEEAVLFIDNFDTLGLTLQFILGNKKIKKCACGRYFHMKSNRQYKCPLCGGTSPIIKERKPYTRNGKRGMGKQKNTSKSLPIS
jgi:hypothetical protein